MRYFLLFLCSFLIYGCSKNTPTSENESTSSPNILLIIADDMGKDATNGFVEGTIKPNTPNLDRLKNEGITFNNLWVNPTCTPTRASVITGNMDIERELKLWGMN